MINYLIKIWDNEGYTSNILCDENNFTNLLIHLDKSRYKILEILVLDNVCNEINEFCQKNNLEHGKN